MSNVYKRQMGFVNRTSSSGWLEQSRGLVSRLAMKPTSDQAKGRVAQLRPKLKLLNRNMTQFEGWNQLRRLPTDCKAALSDYIIGRELGRGANSIVKLATHVKTGTKVAIKVCDRSDAKGTKLLQREVSVLKSLNHPHILKYVNKLETASRVYVALEYIDGPSLLSYLKFKRSLSEREARPIFRGLVQAVACCHAQDVLHRDIKLENILLNEHHSAKLIDFGFAIRFPIGEKRKMYCGTPSYMAPEIHKREEYAGGPADMWALGVVLYAIVCGHLPFVARSEYELTKRIQEGTFSLPNHLSLEVRGLISSLLVVSPAKRLTAAETLKAKWLSVHRSGPLLLVRKSL